MSADTAHVITECLCREYKVYRGVALMRDQGKKMYHVLSENKNVISCVLFKMIIQISRVLIITFIFHIRFSSMKYVNYYKYCISCSSPYGIFSK